MTTTAPQQTAQERGPQAIRRLLVATDFSKAAENAVARACELARSHDAQLVIAHSITIAPVAAGGPPLATLPADFEARVRQASLDALEAATDKAREAGVDAVSEMTVGPPAHSLVGLAEGRGVDLIVIGTRGQTGFAHLMLGSTAEHLIQHARCPVISVHPSDAAPLDTVSRVLLPTDFSQDADDAGDALADLLSHRASEVAITLLHVYQLPAGVSQLLGYVPVATDLDASARSAIDRAMAPQVEALRARGFEVDTVAAGGYAPEVVTAMASTHDIDLIAMGTRGLSGLQGALRGSTARRVVQHAPCPVLTIGRSRH